jgi:succinate dehydrogenase hydrophobic anchor subunit
MSWTLWFVLLSGWPVFLACVGVTVAGMLGLSVVMTRMTERSAVRNMVVALVFLTVVTAGVLTLVVVMTRT